MDYTAPLYILPFDHRASFSKGLLGYTPPLTLEQHKRVSACKRIVFDGFLQVYRESADRGFLGILIDEEFGLPILRECRRRRIIFSVSVEQSGKDVFDFEYGHAFGTHLLRLRPTFAKVLVRYNPDNRKDNATQRTRLKRLSDFCAKERIGFMFELIVPPTQAQKKRHGARYDRDVRPGLMAKGIKELVAAGIGPSVWKLEAVETRKDWAQVIAATKSGGKDPGIIVLGRGEDAKKVDLWLALGATFPEIIGFAVGRTVFSPPLAAYLAGKITKKAAQGRVAANYRKIIAHWEKSRRV